MATRVIYGRSHSSNGWPMVDPGSCTWVSIPGAAVTLQIQDGWPLQILRAFAADFHAYVEPLRDPDSACWTPTNSVPSSNHLSGTAMDLNWNTHPFQARGTFTAAQLATLRDLQAFYEGTVFWGGDWRSPVDEMHWQLASFANGGSINTYSNPAVADFIARKIRPDGFSVFRRDPAPAPATPAAVDVLARATGLTAARAAEILPTMADGLRQADCTTVNRIAMFVAQTGHESDGFARTEEYASGAAYEGRTELGNTQPGDGVRFKGRTWIQVTGRGHYAAFSRWAFDRGLVGSPTHFVDHPAELADIRWAGIGAAWYWTTQRPMNKLVDAAESATWGSYRGFEAVTAAINGGTNGLADRRARYQRALALGDQLLTLTATDPADLLEEMLMLEVESWSIYADPGEPKIPVYEMIQALDAHGPHEEYVEKQARAGDPDAIRRVARTAAGLGKYGTAPGPVSQALAVLADIEATNPAVLQTFLATQKGN